MAKGVSSYVKPKGQTTKELDEATGDTPVQNPTIKPKPAPAPKPVVEKKWYER